MKESRAKLSRRNFLLAATAGTAATAAAVIGKQQQAEQATTADAKPTGKGYQVTEHVQNYYRTARV
jgi:secreted PhoX family phosphatase